MGSQAADAATRSDGWKRVDPQSVGVDAKQLEAIDAYLRAHPDSLVDSLVIARCGAIVFERQYSHDYATIYAAQARADGSGLSLKDRDGEYNYFDARWHPYVHNTDLHTVQSITKSITSVVYGVAVARGDFKASLDTPVLDYFKGRTVQFVDSRKQRMTIRNVLTMRSGLDWPDHGGYTSPENAAMRMEHSQDWAQFVIDHPMAHDPGDHYFYSDGDAILASHVFQKETGQNIAEYAKKYLFAPLGIIDTYWKQTPAGIADTESGMYMRPADLAKIGELYLHNGRWEGRQLVSPEWVHQSVTDNAAQGNGGYGFYWRLRSQGSEQDFIFSAHGFGGQGMHVNPKRNLVVVVYGWHIPKEGTAQEDILKRVLAATSTTSCPAAQ